MDAKGFWTVIGNTLLGLALYVVLGLTGCLGPEPSKEPPKPNFSGVIERIEPVGYDGSNAMLLFYFKDGRAIPFFIDQTIQVEFRINQPCDFYLDGTFNRLKRVTWNNSEVTGVKRE
jgi:hypothetical protein